ncbi:MULTISPECIES: KAP family NTPase [unclassified Pseudomonas]|uniref:KAP family NTPase n=1 Tax=unclassified Pseudomonas TaxID=196821 RepID=UPI000A1DE93D|nr:MULTISPECIES: KAP family NTPase [unclassified Pseudomonas]
MESNDHLARQDRPINNAEADALDRGPFIASLIKALVHTEWNAEGEVTRRATGFVIGLTGEWGLGKSSILNLLSTELKKLDGVVVATLNPWLFKGRDELLQAYFSSLREALGRSNSERIREVQIQLERYKASIEFAGTSVAAIIDIFGSGGATTLWGKCIAKILKTLPKPKDLSANQERKKLEAKLAKANVPVVVLIDELDRVEDDEVRAVAQLVKAVGDIRGISYLVAYDPDRVAQALGRGNDPTERKQTGESYIEKIIQFPISLRPLFADDVKALINNSLRINRIKLPDIKEPYQEEIIQQIIQAARTPREIKRLVGAFAVLEEIVRGEICPYDVLGYSWLITKAPAVRDLIVNNLEAVIDDPNLNELLKRNVLRENNNNKEVSVTDILGSGADAYREILQVLFPRFSKKNIAPNGKRIAKRRNLIRMLYLGNPPGMMPRTEIEKIWSIDNIEKMEKIIVNLQRSEKFPALFDRLGDLLLELPHSGDKIFWVALARTLIRQQDWIKSEESLGSLVEDVGFTLWQHVRSGSEGTIRVKSTVEALIADGDLLVVPWLLRKHLHAHNLTHHSRPNDGEVIYNKNETSKLLEQELPRYRRAIMDETALRRLPNMEAIYCIANSERWDNELRSNLTKQLSNMNAITTFAALTVRPGYVSDRKSMNELIDVDTVLDTADKLEEELGLPENLWLTASFKRLQSTLRGLDPSHIESFNAPNDDA